MPGQPAKIMDFYVGDSPISLAILLDISGSMAVGGNMDRAREAVTVATMNLRAQDDEAALFTFDSELQQVVGFTKDLERIHRVSLKGTPWGKTSLYDAIADTATTVSERANRHRALLVITDGVDTGSRLTAAEVSAVASSIDVPVYLLTVVTPLDHPGTEFEVTSDGRSTQTATLGGSCSLDWRRHAHREHAGAYLRRDSGSVHRAPASVLDQFRARRSSRVASTRDSYTEEGSCRPRARRVHVGPFAQRKLVSS